MKALYRSKVEQILTYMGGAITGFVVGGLTSNVCFVAGTVVSTECGKKVIENIKKGELVWAQDENTGEKMLKKVLRTFINETNELVYVEVKERKTSPIGRRNTYNSRKKAKEAVKRAGGGKEPRHDPNGHKGNRRPHFHPNVPNKYRITPNGVSSHDHYYYPR